MKNEKGSSLLITICLITILFLLLAALLPMMAAEVRASGNNSNYVIAQSAADGAAYYELQRVQNSLNNAVVPDDDSFSDNRISITSSAKVSCGCTRVTTSSSDLIQIRAVATCGTSSASASINVYLDSTSPITTTTVSETTTVLNMINTADYSHSNHNPQGGSDTEVRWGITSVYDNEGNVTARYSQPSGVSQAMFSDASTSDTIDISYTACAKPTTATVSGGGYGIYYGMIGNADDMNAYVVQWDPGAQNDKSKKYSNGEYYAAYGTLLVKKVIFAGNVYDNSNKSAFLYNTGNSPGLKEKNNWSVNSGGNADNYACPFQSAIASEGEVLRIPLSAADDPTNSLEAKMEAYTGHPFDLTAAHTIRIKTELINGKMWHYIYCDPNPTDANPTPVLKFYEHSTGDAARYSLTSFKGTYMGLRVWSDQVRVNFNNATSNTTTTTNGRTFAKSIVWIR
jgi:hypothetical protein